MSLAQPRPAARDITFVDTLIVLMVYSNVLLRSGAIKALPGSPYVNGNAREYRFAFPLACSEMWLMFADALQSALLTHQNPPSWTNAYRRIIPQSLSTHIPYTVYRDPLRDFETGCWVISHPHPGCMFPSNDQIMANKGLIKQVGDAYGGIHRVMYKTAVSLNGFMTTIIP